MPTSIGPVATRLLGAQVDGRRTCTERITCSLVELSTKLRLCLSSNPRAPCRPCLASRRAGNTVSDGPLRYVSLANLQFVDMGEGCPETQAISLIWRGFPSWLRLSHFILVSPRRTTGSWPRSSGGIRPATQYSGSQPGSLVCFMIVSSVSLRSHSPTRRCALISSYCRPDWETHLY